MKPTQSFNSYIENSIKDNWDRDALTDYKGATLQYHDVARKIAKLHILFRHSGLQPGDKVALCGRNSSAWAAAFLATITYGAVAVPIQHEFTPDMVYNIAIIYELLWFLRGDTNVRWLQDHGVRIWNEWADENGDLGPVYGHQWRSWPDYRGGTIDQIAQVEEMIKRNPNSRRMLVTAWNPAEVEDMALPPCHCLFQFYVADGRLSLQLYQRSADTFLGVPFNIASYALLLQMMAQVTGLQPGEFVHTTGDTHLYLNHLEQARLQLSRTPRPLPTMRINPDVKSIFDFRYEDFELENYDPWPHIAAEVSV